MADIQMSIFAFNSLMVYLDINSPDKENQIDFNCKYTTAIIIFLIVQMG